MPIVNGQTGFFGTGLQYSEGGVTVYNEDGMKVGMGFAEATGYAKNTKNVLAIAELPETQKIIDILEPKTPVSEQLAIVSGEYLMFPGNKEKLEKIMKEAKGLNNMHGWSVSIEQWSSVPRRQCRNWSLKAINKKNSCY